MQSCGVAVLQFSWLLEFVGLLGFVGSNLVGGSLVPTPRLREAGRLRLEAINPCCCDAVLRLKNIGLKKRVRGYETHCRQ